MYFKTQYLFQFILCTVILPALPFNVYKLFILKHLFAKMVSLALPNLIRSFFWLCNCAFSIFLTTPLSSGKLVVAKREAFNPQIAHKNNAILIHIVLCDILYCIWLAELSKYFMYSTEFQGIPQKSTTFHRMSGKAIVFR